MGRSPINSHQRFNEELIDYGKRSDLQYFICLSIRCEGRKKYKTKTTICCCHSVTNVGMAQTTKYDKDFILETICG
jgi:hypothetical protein